MTYATRLLTYINHLPLVSSSSSKILYHTLSPTIPDPHFTTYEYSQLIPLTRYKPHPPPIPQTAGKYASGLVVLRLRQIQLVPTFGLQSLRALAVWELRGLSGR